MISQDGVYVERREVQDDKPIKHLNTSVTRQNGVGVVACTAVCHALVI